MFEEYEGLFVYKTPALSSIDFSDDIYHFVTDNLLEDIDWDIYRAILILDLDNVYLGLFEKESDLLVDCVHGSFKENNWDVTIDKDKAIEKVKNIMDLLDTKDTFETKDRW